MSFGYGTSAWVRSSSMSPSCICLLTRHVTQPPALWGSRMSSSLSLAITSVPPRRGFSCAAAGEGLGSLAKTAAAAADIPSLRLWARNLRRVIRPSTSADSRVVNDSRCSSIATSLTVSHVRRRKPRSRRRNGDTPGPTALSRASTSAERSMRFGRPRGHRQAPLSGERFTAMSWSPPAFGMDVLSQSSAYGETVLRRQCVAWIVSTAPMSAIAAMTARSAQTNRPDGREKDRTDIDLNATVGRVPHIVATRRYGMVMLHAPNVLYGLHFAPALKRLFADESSNHTRAVPAFFPLP